MKIAILGSGDCAHSLAFECARAGNEVYIFDILENESILSGIASHGGIYSIGKLDGPMSRFSTN